MDRIGLRTAFDPVVALAAVDRVETGIAIEHVRPRAPEHKIVPGAGSHNIIATKPVQSIDPATTFDQVVAFTAVQSVIRSVSEQCEWNRGQGTPVDIEDTFSRQVLCRDRLVRVSDQCHSFQAKRQDCAGYGWSDAKLRDIIEQAICREVELIGSG